VLLAFKDKFGFSLLCTYLGGSSRYITAIKTSFYSYCEALISLSSITKKGEIESASRPLVGFGVLDDNTLKS
jgi:hypothetical protein